MSSSRLEKFVKPMENSIQKKVSNEIDEFWEDCIDSPKIKEDANKKLNINSANSNNPEEVPEEYITCNFFDNIN